MWGFVSKIKYLMINIKEKYHINYNNGITIVATLINLWIDYTAHRGTYISLKLQSNRNDLPHYLSKYTPTHTRARVILSRLEINLSSNFFNQ